MSPKKSNEKTPKKKEQLPKPDPTEQVSERMLNLFGQVTLKPYKLPTMTWERPYNIPRRSGTLTALNASLIGSLIATDDKADIVKNILRLAEVRNDDAVLVTGNIMYMITQRYGNQRAHKTQVSGIEINPIKVDETYPKTVRKDRKFVSAEKRLQKGEPVFITLKSRLEHNLELLRKTFIDGNGKPLYNGPVLITFGKLEDELIMFYANELLRVGLFKTRTWAQKMVWKYTAEWRKASDSKKKKRIWQKVKDFKEFLNIFAVMSNIADESIRSARAIVSSFIIKKYEEYIPNSKVLSVGNAFLKHEGRTIMVTTDKQRSVLRGKLAEMLASKTESFSKARRPGQIPSLMLGMGFNPFADIRFVTYQASDNHKDKRMCTILQLPMSIDAERYRNVIRDQNILKDIITKVALESGFESGVFTISWHDNVAQPLMSFWTSDILKNREIFKDKKNIQDLIEGNKKQHQMIYGHKKGCSHYGANDILLFDCECDPKRPVKYQYQIAIEFLLNANAPIHMDQHDGDITQQANHPYQKYLHPRYMLPEELMDEMNRIRDSKMSETEKLHKVIKLAFTQKVYDGILLLDKQVQGYALSLVPCLEYFLKIIERKKKAKLTFEGRLSAIMHIMGNHCKNTYKTKDTFVSDAEAITHQIQKFLIAYLLESGLPQIKKDDIFAEVTAPQHGPLGEGRGSFGIEGFQRYAMILKHKQGKMDRTHKRSQQRGVNEHEVGLPLYNLSGDNHKGGIRITRGIVNIKTGGQQDESPYGREIDGSEQNVFSVVYGVPVGGFASGPVSFLILDEETMRNYAKKPFKLDPKTLFKNAIE